jgi:hypothetical protein
MPAWNTLTLESPELGISVLTLNRPKALNAITYETIEAFHDALREPFPCHTMNGVENGSTYGALPPGL